MFAKDETLYIGIPEIDQAHAKLDGLIKEIGKLLIANAAVDEFRRLCLQFIAAAKDHFAEEERLLAPYGLKNMAAHQVEHQRLIKELTKASENISVGGGEWRQALMELSDIITRHIITYDFAVIPHLNKKAES